MSGSDESTGQSRATPNGGIRDMSSMCDRCLISCYSTPSCYGNSTLRLEYIKPTAGERRISLVQMNF
jgi:hypothetical protein